MLVGAAASILVLAACGDGEETEEPDPSPEIEEPADDPEAAPEGEIGDDGELAEPLPEPGFDDLEEGEVVPGVRIDAPVDEETSTGQPIPTGSAFVGSLAGETGALTVNVELDYPGDVDGLLAGIDALVESGQAEVTDGPSDAEVEGADDAQRVELTSEGATAVAVFAIAGGNGISVAVESIEGADLDVDAILDSIVIDPDRLALGAAAGPDDGTAPEQDGSLDDGEDADDGGEPDGGEEPDDGQEG